MIVGCQKLLYFLTTVQPRMTGPRKGTFSHLSVFGGLSLLLRLFPTAVSWTLLDIDEL